MVVTVIEGSSIIETGLEERLKKDLRRIIQKENQIVFYFYADNPFSLMCEWAVRELQAIYPKKQIENVVVLRNEERVFPKVRFTRIERLPINAEKGMECWRWMIDKADYTLFYMHPWLCTSRDRLRAYQYAMEKLGSRCINFASQSAWEQVCKQVPSLVKWERQAFEGRLQKRRRKDIAAEMGVHPSTVRGYEIAACYSLAKRVYTKSDGNRKCAILDFTAKTLSEWKRELLYDTLDYLVRYGGVSEFVIPGIACNRYTDLMECLLRVRGRILRPIKISTMQTDSDQVQKWQYRGANSPTIFIKRSLQHMRHAPMRSEEQ